MSSSSSVCFLCGKALSSKYALQTHLRGVHRHSDNGEPIEEMTCSSTRCPFATYYRQDHKRHSDKCLYVELDRVVAAYEQTLSSMREELRILSKTCHLSSSTDDLLTTLTAERILQVADTHLQAYFWLGQRGLAIFLVDCVIRDTVHVAYPTDDESLSRLLGRVRTPLLDAIEHLYKNIIADPSTACDPRRLVDAKKVYESDCACLLSSGSTDFVKELVRRLRD